MFGVNMGDVSYKFLIFELCALTFVYCQYGNSPCPDIFEYRTDGGDIYGWIDLRPIMTPVTVINLMADFTVATRLGSSYIGRIDPAGPELQLLESYNRGQSISYRVNFPVTSPLPRVTSIAVNGNTICQGPGDSLTPGRYVTTLRLQHTLYLKSGSLPMNTNWPQPTRPEPVPTYQSTVTNNRDSIQYQGTVTNNRDSILYTFGDANFDENRNGIFNAGQDIQDVYVRNTTRPVARPSPPQNPVYDIYPTVQQPRPQPTPFRPQPMETMPPPPPIVPETPPPTRPPTTAPAPTEAPIECGVVSGGNERVPLIFNGQSFSRGDWPWLVAIYKRKDGGLTFICSGTLISERHVISAAHCVQQKNSRTRTEDVVVKVGVFNLQDWGDDITVTRKITTASIHQNYNPNTLSNDILVITLERTVTFNSNIRPACLWNGNKELNRIVGSSGVVIGWGDSELGPGGRGEPRMIHMPVVSTDACRASRPDFHRLTSSTTLCAGDRNGAGPCLGDSGGGLYIFEEKRWRIRGVVSLSLRSDNGENTCNLNEYIVFTDTAQYLPWINLATK